ncbi:MAG: YceD family protein [Desulfobaccales bacterium]
MYSLRLTKVPENGTLRQPNMHLDLADLGLTAPFDPAGVELSFELTRMMEKVFGKVRAQAGARHSCGRCLGEFDAPVRADFVVQFEAKPAEGPGQEEDIDPDAPDRAVAYYEGDEIPLGEEIRQELELQLPFAPVCRKDCKGRCPSCGQDLNVQDCGHGPVRGNDAFSALKQLFNDPERA